MVAAVRSSAGQIGLIPVAAEFRSRQGRAGIAVPCSRCLRPNSERRVRPRGSAAELRRALAGGMRIATGFIAKSIYRTRGKRAADRPQMSPIYRFRHFSSSGISFRCRYSPYRRMTWFAAVRIIAIGERAARHFWVIAGSETVLTHLSCWAVPSCVVED